MKKLLFGLCALMSVSALAGEYNVYVKGGVNYNKGVMVKDDLFDKIQDGSKDVINQKIKTMPGIATPLPLVGKVFNDPNKLDSGVNSLRQIAGDAINNSLITDKNKLNFNANLELTKNINDNLEIGLGTGYMMNPKITHKLDKQTLENALKSEETKNALKQIDGIKKDRVAPFVAGVIVYMNLRHIKDNFNAKFTEPHFNTIPVYVTAKYNLGKFNEFKPYVKADLGYAFNVGLENPSFEYEGLKQAGGMVHDGFEGLKNATNDAKVTVDNAIYVGGAVGTEYKNFIGEVALSYSKATINYNLKVNGAEVKDRIDASNFRVGVNAGYKFNF